MPGMRHSGAMRCSSASRTWSGSSIRSRPSTCSTSKNHGRSAVALIVSDPKRAMVSWNGRGPPSASSDRVSPSRMTSSTGSARTVSTISGTRWVMSARLRVKTRTLSPFRCTWMRAPSSLNSTDASPATVATASATDPAVEASIGSTGRPTCSPTSAELAFRAGQGDPGRLAEIARQHRGAAHDRRGLARRARHRVEQHALESAGAQLTEDHAGEEIPLLRRCGAGEIVQFRASGAHRPRSGCRGQSFQRGIHLEHRQRRFAGTSAGERGETAPSDSDPPLARLCDQEADRRRDLVAPRAGPAASRAPRSWPDEKKCSTPRRSWRRARAAASPNPLIRRRQPTLRQPFGSRVLHSATAIKAGWKKRRISRVRSSVRPKPFLPFVYCSMLPGKIAR